MTFSKTLINWYIDNKRDLPWRETKNPYLIWLSEIILQQTRVAQGLPYFEAFRATFPTVFDLANAQEDDILRLWQGLGYYSRARNMHATAKKIAFELDGQFPTNYHDLLSLKGVGEYTAAAIASIAFKEVVPVVDGNVFRVLSRIYGITSDISKSGTKKEFQSFAQNLISYDQPDIFNQAIMDFGAMQCTPKKTNCSACIFINKCIAYQTNQVDKLPYKSKKVKAKNRYLNFIIPLDNDKNTIIEQRKAKDIWQNLYQFPCIDNFENHTITPDSFLKENYPNNTFDKIILLNNTPIIHQLSHQKLHINFWMAKTNNKLTSATHWSNLNNFGFPIVIYNFIQSLNI